MILNWFSHLCTAIDGLADVSDAAEVMPVLDDEVWPNAGVINALAGVKFGIDMLAGVDIMVVANGTIDTEFAVDVSCDVDVLTGV